MRLIVVKLNIKIKKEKRFNTREIDADTSFKIEKQILTDEIDNPEYLEFAIENYSGIFGYSAIGNLNIKGKHFVLFHLAVF